MYQTRRNERNFTGPLRRPKIERGQRVQTIRDGNTGRLKHIIHEEPTEQQVASLSWYVLHGIKPGTVISNRYKPVRNKILLKVEGEKIRLKKSNLSYSERVAVLDKLNG